MSERIEVAEIKADIKAAFKGWLDAWFDSLGPEGASPEDLLCESKIESSKADAMTFLAQVEAERKQLHDALIALARIREIVNTDAANEEAMSGQYREIDALTFIALTRSTRDLPDSNWD